MSSSIETMAGKREQKRLQDLQTDSFIRYFNPNRSKRHEAKTIFDGAGRIRETKKDVCDCLDDGCVGCHFPCKKCLGTKCGPICRQNRNDYIEQIRIDGRENKHTIHNPNFGEKKK